ncbi:RNA polymerase sigma factor FecI [Nitrospira sp. KM1]|uniref:sigma-70 family RNA polymerase sigma factor n=1 Tax=Nitrospira sp. KM1 TaxID=1936990 RepID=UPI0013A76F5D|nr:sigma-70 family RNA polymerase sigma factor [Nitrospira sp. KM1]BCA52869.1 RNA polymerase sigma factor FecI [Nitrospira sp. KM1]
MDNQAAADRYSLFREYYDELVSYLTLKLRSRDHAMDIAQETYLRVMTQESSAPILQPRAFLYKTALNLAIDLFRKTKRQAEESLDSDDVQDALVVEADQHTRAETREQVRQLYEAILELPPRCRQVFLLHKFKDRSHAEIAAHFGISISMVEKHIIKATSFCRERFKDSI